MDDRSSEFNRLMQKGTADLERRRKSATRKEMLIAGAIGGFLALLALLHLFGP